MTRPPSTGRTLAAAMTATMTATMAMMAACIDNRPVFLGGAGGQAQTDGGGGVGGQPNDGAADKLVLAPCVATPVSRDLITDFSDAHPALLGTTPDIEFEVQPGIVGGSFTFQRSGPTVTSLTIEPRGADQALGVTAKPRTPINGQATGFGFGIGWGATDGQCLDATGYTGVRFTIEGTLGTCQLQVGANFSRDLDNRLNLAGTCASGGEQCGSPLSGVLNPNTGTLEARFADMSGGSPVDLVDVTSLTGILWAFVAPADGSCDATFTVDDVAFYR